MPALEFQSHCITLPTYQLHTSHMVVGYSLVCTRMYLYEDKPKCNMQVKLFYTFLPLVSAWKLSLIPRPQLILPLPFRIRNEVTYKLQFFSPCSIFFPQSLLPSSLRSSGSKTPGRSWWICRLDDGHPRLQKREYKVDQCLSECNQGCFNLTTYAITVYTPVSFQFWPCQYIHYHPPNFR